MDPVLLILAGITAFIIFRLISVMGTRTGHEDPKEFEQIHTRAASQSTDSPVEDEAPRPVRKPVSANAQNLREADPDFDEAQFIAGAKSAYEMIVEAFAAGDLRSIRPYLSESVFDAFKQAVRARDDAQLTTDMKFVGIERASVLSSDADDDTVSAVVEFTSNQVRVTRDADGEIVDGDPNRIDLVKDQWVFNKKRSSRDPNWILVGTGGSA